MFKSLYIPTHLDAVYDHEADTENMEDLDVVGVVPYRQLKRDSFYYQTIVFCMNINKW